MTYLEKYATLHIQREAIDAVLKAIKKEAKKELQLCKNEQADYLGVKFHMTNKPKTVFLQNFGIRLKELNASIKRLKARAKELGEFKTKNKYTFDAEIPSPIKKDLFETVPQYVEHFGKRK